MLFSNHSDQEWEKATPRWCPQGPDIQVGEASSLCLGTHPALLIKVPKSPIPESKFTEFFSSVTYVTVSSHYILEKAVQDQGNIRNNKSNNRRSEKCCTPTVQQALG